MPTFILQHMFLHHVGIHLRIVIKINNNNIISKLKGRYKVLQEYLI